MIVIRIEHWKGGDPQQAELIYLGTVPIEAVPIEAAPLKTAPLEAAAQASAAPQAPRSWRCEPVPAAPKALGLPKFRLRTLLTVVAVIAVVLGAVRYWQLREERQLWRLEKAFSGYFDRYDTGPASANLPSEPAIRGKLLVLDREGSTWRVSPVQLLLPDELRAEEPGEVGTLVWAEFERVKYGEYAGKIPVYASRARVVLVDVAEAKPIGARGDFQEGPPPNKPPRGGGPGLGPRPIEEIAAYLIALPRR
jgi:hypothetical protein